MKCIMKKIIIIVCLLLANLPVFSQENVFTIGGIIGDISKKKIVGANIILLEKETSEILKGLTTMDGSFLINGIPKGEYVIKVSFIGYKEVVKPITVDNRNINDIEIILEEDNIKLSEIIITANNVEMFADRSTYRLSESDRSSFSNALDVLNIIPRLNAADQSLGTVDGKAVKILINGINSDETDLSVINTKDILRIEYYENPPIRFTQAGLGAVVNLITKRDSNGGVVALNLQNAPFNAYGNDVVSFKYNFNNSQIGLKYNINYRDSRERLLDENLEYQFDNITYSKDKRGISGTYNFADQLFEVSFSNSKVDNYVFSSKFSLKDYDHKRESRQAITQIYPDYIEKIGLSNDVDMYVSPNLDLYFNKIFNEKHEILINFVGTYFDSKYNYDYSETYDDLLDFETATDIDGSKYSFIGDAIYGYNFEKNRINIGAKYSTGISELNINSQTNQTTSQSDNIIVYGEFSGTKNKLSYKLSTGIDYSTFNSDELNKTYSFTAFKPSLTLSYNLNRYSNINFYYNTNSINPTLAQLSPTKYLLDYKFAYSGNPELKPYNQHDLQLGYFYNKNSFLIGSFVSYSYAKKPILPFFKKERDNILETFDNLNESQKYTWGVNLQWFPLASNILRLNMYTEFYHSSNSFLEVRWKHNDYRIIPSIVLNYKKWNLTGRYISNAKDLAGQRLTESPSTAMVELSFKPIQNLTATLAIRYPFYDAWEKSSETHESALVQTYGTERIKDMTNMVYLRVVHNFSFGRKGKDIKQRLENIDIDSGIFARP